MIQFRTMRTGGLPLLLLLCSALLTSACANGPRPLWRMNYFQPVASETIVKEILRFETEIDRNPVPVNAAPYYNLALLHAHYNNPAPDYSRSLALCEQYLALNPDGDRKGEVLYLKTLLQKQTEADGNRTRYQKETQKLRQSAEQLTKQNEVMLLENQNLKATIKKLEMLDLRLEEQRQNL